MEGALSESLNGKKPEEVTELFLDKRITSPVLRGLNEHRFDLLETLSLKQIGLSSLENFPNLPRLKRLDLADNRLTGGLSHLVSANIACLISLNLANNAIRKLSELEPLSSFENLVFLNLTGCPVTTTPDYRLSVLTLIPSLRSLDQRDVQSPFFMNFNAEDTKEDDTNSSSVFDVRRSKSTPPPLGGKLYRVFEVADDETPAKTTRPENRRTGTIRDVPIPRKEAIAESPTAKAASDDGDFEDSDTDEAEDDEKENRRQLLSTLLESQISDDESDDEDFDPVHDPIDDEMSDEAEPENESFEDGEDDDDREISPSRNKKTKRSNSTTVGPNSPNEDLDSSKDNDTSIEEEEESANIAGSPSKDELIALPKGDKTSTTGNNVGNGHGANQEESRKRKSSEDAVLNPNAESLEDSSLGSNSKVDDGLSQKRRRTPSD